MAEVKVLWFNLNSPHHHSTHDIFILFDFLIPSNIQHVHRIIQISTYVNLTRRNHIQQVSQFSHRAVAAPCRTSTAIMAYHYSLCMLPFNQSRDFGRPYHFLSPYRECPAAAATLTAAHQIWGKSSLANNWPVAIYIKHGQIATRQSSPCSDMKKDLHITHSTAQQHKCNQHEQHGARWGEIELLSIFGGNTLEI